MLRLIGPDKALPTSRTPPNADWLTLDLAHLSNVSQAAALLDSHSLDAIYCIAGMTNVEACEDLTDLAHRTNAIGPAVLAQYARRRDLPFVYFSTEYIFDGQSGPYCEEDAPNPISVYGRSKLNGECAVLQAQPDALILRTTVVYGPDDRHKNYIYHLISANAERRSIRVPEDQISTPTYNQDLVRAAFHLVSVRASGVFHVCGPELLSRIDFARAVSEQLGLDPSLLQPVPTSELSQRAPRPLCAGLRTEKFIQVLPAVHLRPLAEAIADCSGQLRAFQQRLNHDMKRKLDL